MEYPTAKLNEHRFFNFFHILFFFHLLMMMMFSRRKIKMEFFNRFQLYVHNFDKMLRVLDKNIYDSFVIYLIRIWLSLNVAHILS